VIKKMYLSIDKISLNGKKYKNDGEEVYGLFYDEEGKTVLISSEGDVYDRIPEREEDAIDTVSGVDIITGGERADILHVMDYMEIDISKVSEEEFKQIEDEVLRKVDHGDVNDQIEEVINEILDVDSILLEDRE